MKVYLDRALSALRWILLALVTFLFFFPVFAVGLCSRWFDPTVRHTHFFIRFWAKAVLLVCPVMKVKVAGAQQLKSNQAYVIVANHQSISDILALLLLKHPFKFIAKKELFWIPIFGWAVAGAGYIPLIRGNSASGQQALLRARTYLHQKMSILFFPEGTRSLNGEIQAFKIGAFKLAAEAGVSVVPIVINGTQKIVPKGSHYLTKKEKVMVQVLKPCYTQGTEPQDIQSFCDHTRSEMIAELARIRNQEKQIELTSVA